MALALKAEHFRNGSRSYGDGGKGLAPLSLCEIDGGAPMTQVTRSQWQ